MVNSRLQYNVHNVGIFMGGVVNTNLKCNYGKVSVCNYDRTYERITIVF